MTNRRSRMAARRGREAESRAGHPKKTAAYFAKEPMSRSGNVLDNAVMKSFFSFLRAERMIARSCPYAGSFSIDEDTNTPQLGPKNGVFAMTVRSSAATCRQLML